MMNLWHWGFPERGVPSQGRAHRLSHKHGMNRHAILIAALCALALTGCDLGGGGGDVPAQTFVNGLTAAVSQTGQLRGQIVFPSEYAQHSIRFALDDVTFVTHPDGRVHLSNVPVGQHWLDVRIKGYE